METFRKLADKYGNSIDDTLSAEIFFNELMQETEGCVNVDFIDGNNFDRIQKVEFNHTYGILKLYFHLPEKDEEMRQMRKMAFPFDTYSMTVKLDKIRFVKSGDKIIGFYIQGFTDHKRCIKKTFRGSLGNIDYVEHKTEFYASDLLKRESGLIEDTVSIDTPIISCWVIPKDFFISTTESRRILYELNLKRLHNRLSRCQKNHPEKNSTASSKEERQELFETTGNTLRNLLESLLKLKLNYYYSSALRKVDAYHQLLVGDLINILTRLNVISDEEKKVIQNFVLKANELSHASGIPAKVEELESMFDQLDRWIKDFKAVTDKIGTFDPSFSSKNANANTPDEFIKQNLPNWDFSEEIKNSVRAKSGKCLFRIKREKDFFNPLDFFDGKGIYLQSDGKFHESESGNALKIFSREEALTFRENIISKVSQTCQNNGYDIPSSLSLNLNIELEKNGIPSHLFTLDEIRDLMRKADDSKYNQLVIDEDGYPHLVQEQGMGSLYPVSQETWCPYNWYVGENSSLSDAEPSYHLCLEGWLFYLTTGQRFYSDLYPNIDVETTIAKIKSLMSD